MKYTLELDIAAPRSTVVGIFDNPHNWPKWQESLVSWNPLGGTARDIGARTRLVNRVGFGNVEMTETIESKNLPEEITCLYEARGAWNRVVNRFVEIDSTRTRWVFESEFRCTGILRMLNLIMPGMFRRASLKEMNSFKRLAERESAHA